MCVEYEIISMKDEEKNEKRIMLRNKRRKIYLSFSFAAPFLFIFIFCAYHSKKEKNSIKYKTSSHPSFWQRFLLSFLLYLYKQSSFSSFCLLLAKENIYLNTSLVTLTLDDALEDACVCV